MTTQRSAPVPDAGRLAAIGIGSAALHGISSVAAPGVGPNHPRVISSAVDKASIAAAAAAGSVVDPEIPVLTVADLGVLRRVAVDQDNAVDVDITPTYSGCPAVAAIATDIRRSLQRAGYPTVRVHTVLAPAWTTDDMTDAARDVLQRFGIAPPGDVRKATGTVALSLAVRCPQCGSRQTRETSRFGSTACKAMYACDDCREPFDHFKPL